MKTKHILAASTFALLALASCSQDEVTAPKSNFPEDGVIRVATTLNDPQSRAGATTENLDEFYLNITNASSTTYSYYAMMRKDDAAGVPTTNWNSYEVGSSIPYTPLTMLWQNKTTSVTVTAVAKYGVDVIQSEFTNGINSQLPPNQSSESQVRLSDLLYMPTKTVNPETDITAEGKISVALSHRFAKLIVEVTLGTEYNVTPGTATNPISDMAVNGTFRGYTFVPATNVLTLFQDAPSTVTPFSLTYSAGEAATKSAVATYECILVPQEVAVNTFSISFAINDRTYVWTSKDAVTLAENTKHTLSLTVGKDLVSVGTITATPWGDEQTGTIETE